METVAFKHWRHCGAERSAKTENAFHRAHFHQNEGKFALLDRELIGVSHFYIKAKPTLLSSFHKPNLKYIPIKQMDEPFWY